MFAGLLNGGKGRGPVVKFVERRLFVSMFECIIAANCGNLRPI